MESLSFEDDFYTTWNMSGTQNNVLLLTPYQNVTQLGTHKNEGLPICLHMLVYQYSRFVCSNLNKLYSILRLIQRLIFINTNSKTQQSDKGHYQGQPPDRQARNALLNRYVLSLRLKETLQKQSLLMRYLKDFEYTLELQSIYMEG